MATCPRTASKGVGIASNEAYELRACSIASIKSTSIGRHDGFRRDRHDSYPAMPSSAVRRNLTLADTLGAAFAALIQIGFRLLRC